MRLRKTSVGNGSIWYDGDLLAPCDPRIFDTAWLRQSGALTGSSTGRNQTLFLRHQGREMVLRHFWRGGLIGKINPDLFLRQSVAQSRAMREMMLLDWMRGQGLPVPQPVAARFSPMGLFYRADIITLRLQDTCTLAEVLRDHALAPPLWAELGAVIARMHEAGVHHSDLNCRNILLQNGNKIWLIDFDKCERRAPGPWAQENLARLKRSFEKEKTKMAGLYWQDTDWLALINGYQKARP